MRQAGDMPPSLPFPLRIAAGLLARGLETARRIPGDLPGLGVELAGNTAKLAMVIRNELTDLAVRGDELLAGRVEPEDNPSWATFDDDAPVGASSSDTDTEVGGTDDHTDQTSGAEDDGVTEPDSAVRPLTEDELTADTAASSSVHLAAAEAVLPGWTMLTIAQLRGHLGHLSAAEVGTLLRNEQDGANRPAFVTLLANRISTLEHAAGSR